MHKSSHDNSLNRWHPSLSRLKDAQENGTFKKHLASPVLTAVTNMYKDDVDAPRAPVDEGWRDGLLLGLDLAQVSLRRSDWFQQIRPTLLGEVREQVRYMKNIYRGGRIERHAYYEALRAYIAYQSNITLENSGYTQFMSQFAYESYPTPSDSENSKRRTVALLSSFGFLCYAVQESLKEPAMEFDMQAYPRSDNRFPITIKYSVGTTS